MILLTAFWFFLPAGLANGAPVLIRKVPVLNRWDTPLDSGKSYRGKRILGPHKTWRGLLAGIVLALIIIGLQKYFYIRHDWIQEISWFDYRSGNVWLLGVLFGAGALLGDATESFIKRQKGVTSGKLWFPYDQIDYIIGGLLLTLPLVRPSIELIASVFVVYFGLHLLFTYIFYLIGFREKPI